MNAKLLADLGQTRTGSNENTHDPSTYHGVSLTGRKLPGGALEAARFCWSSWVCLPVGGRRPIQAACPPGGRRVGPGEGPPQPAREAHQCVRAGHAGTAARGCRWRVSPSVVEMVEGPPCPPLPQLVRGRSGFRPMLTCCCRACGAADQLPDGARRAAPSYGMRDGMLAGARYGVSKRVNSRQDASHMACVGASWVPRDCARVSCREFGCGKLHAFWLEVGSDGTGSRGGGGSGQGRRR